MSTMEDDHYIADFSADIDTTVFKDELRVEIRKNAKINDDELVELIYDKASTIISKAPVEPRDDTIICR